jgi:hypothetical protein
MLVMLFVQILQHFYYLFDSLLVPSDRQGDKQVNDV